MLNRLTPYNTLAGILAVSVATILGALLFEYLGFLPCELCLLQRWPYYAAIVFAVVGLGMANSIPKTTRFFLALLGIVFLFSTVFGIYHAGVEWKFWAGPDTCTGMGDLTIGLPDLTKPAVMCDEPALRILGVSLAGWNAIISLALSAIAFRATAKSYGSSSVSQ